MKKQVKHIIMVFALSLIMICSTFTGLAMSNDTSQTPENETETVISETTDEFDEETEVQEVIETEEVSVTDKKLDVKESDSKEIVSHAATAANEETTTHTVIIDWNDRDKSEYRPNSIFVYLYMNNFRVIDTREVKAQDDWTYTWDNLPRYDDDGKEIFYSAQFATDAFGNFSIRGYDDVGLSSRVGTKTTISIYASSRYEVLEKGDIVAKIEWLNDDSLELPEKVVLKLVSHDPEFYQEVEVTAADNWEYTWENLIKKDTLGTINYTISQDDIPGFILTSSKNGDDFKLTYNQKIDVSATVEWNDGENPNRPKGVTLKLFRSPANNPDDMTEMFGRDVIVNEDNKWSSTWEDLPKYNINNGQEFVYTVLETHPEGYSVDLVKEKDHFIFTNILCTAMPITITKTWDDENNLDGIRPTSIEVEIYRCNDRDPEWKYVRTVEVKEADGWKLYIDDLPFYPGIEYKIEEKGVGGYKSEISTTRDFYKNEYDFHITNKHVPEKRGSLTIVKESEGAITPADTTFTVIGPNGYKRSIQFSEFTDGKIVIKDLKQGTYTVTEEGAEVDGYTLTVTGDGTQSAKITLESLNQTVKFINTYTEDKTETPDVPEIPETPTSIKENEKLIIYKIDQNKYFLQGAQFELYKITEDGDVLMNQESGEAKFVFTDITDGKYRLEEVEVPDSYTGIEPVEFEIIKGVVYIEGSEVQAKESLAVVNTNDGTKASVLGDEFTEEQYDNWLNQLELDSTTEPEEPKEIETSKGTQTGDNTHIAMYAGASVVSLGIVLLVMKKKRELLKNK